jgi:hypothetical protein
MKITRKQLRRIIKEELIREIEINDPDFSSGSTPAQAWSRVDTPFQQWLVEILVGFTPAGIAIDARDITIAVNAGDIFGTALAGIGFIPLVGDIIAKPFKILYKSRQGASAYSRANNGVDDIGEITSRMLSQAEAEATEIVDIWRAQGASVGDRDISIAGLVDMADGAAVRQRVLRGFRALDAWRPSLRGGQQWRINNGSRSSIFGIESSRKVIIVEFESGGKKLFYRSTGTSMPGTSHLDGAYLPFNGFAIFPYSRGSGPSVWYHKDVFAGGNKVPDPNTDFHDIMTDLSHMDDEGLLNIGNRSTSLPDTGDGPITLQALEVLETANHQFLEQGVSIPSRVASLGGAEAWVPGVNGTAEEIFSALQAGRVTPGWGR